MTSPATAVTTQTRTHAAARPHGGTFAARAGLQPSVAFFCFVAVAINAALFLLSPTLRRMA